MKADELRIGNYILHEPTIDDWEEIIITLPSLLQIDISPESYCGIPLTEEWLLNFGFETYTTEKSKVYKLGNFMVIYVLKGRFAGNKYLKAFNISFSEFGHIKHVHTLQNLYFALTGEELQIKK